jgi:Nif-specific regulatory protein
VGNKLDAGLNQVIYPNEQEVTKIMKPKILSIAGPLKAMIAELEDDEISIGRDTQNSIVINDLSISRQHCSLRRENGQYKIVDRGSHNKTFVNNKLVKEKMLEHGDQIKIGSSSFIFLVDEIETPASSSKVELEDGTLITKKALRMPIENALYLMARDLNALLSISTTISSFQKLEALQRHLLKRIFEVVPAERGCILLSPESSTEFENMFGMERYESNDEKVRISRTIAQQVLRERIAILSNEVLDGNQFSDAQSLISSHIRSLLCVPIVSQDKALGVIYLDSRNPSIKFDKDQLQMVTAIANIAAGALASVQHVEWLERENEQLRTSLNIEHDMLGRSLPMDEILKLISRVGPTNLTVLISGESGTGKELAARAIHKNSPRKLKPFVSINCAAIPETLFESELFGHDKGAYTDARTQKKGLLETANGGTVFLDEIGDMPLLAQSKLLRVLQERELLRVGSTQPIKIDIRVVAATNKNLEEAIQQGTFRRDLYFRLNVFPLIMPPLRDRREDILVLARHFIQKHSEQSTQPIKGLSTEACARLINYNWPGNVRELENSITHAIALCSTDYISPEDLPRSLLVIGDASTQPRTFQQLVNEAKRKFVLDALQQTDGDYSEAAKLLGMHPNNLHRLIRTLNLKGSW